MSRPVAHTNCLECGTPLCSARRLRRGCAVHKGRGLCSPCYQSARRLGRLINFERVTLSNEDMLDAWRTVGGPGLTHPIAAMRMGVELDALQNALLRAGIRRRERASVSV